LTKLRIAIRIGSERLTHASAVRRKRPSVVANGQRASDFAPPFRKNGVFPEEFDDCSTHGGGNIIKVSSLLSDVRRTLESLVQRRDERCDGFVQLMQMATHEKLGADADEVAKVLNKQCINRQLAKQALGLAREQGAFTVFALIDALTRLAQESKNAGDQLDADQQAARLFDLISPASLQLQKLAPADLAVAT
jgi:hypothetical protein